MLTSDGLASVAVRGALPLLAVLLIGQVFPRQVRLRRTLSALTALYLALLLPLVVLKVSREVGLLPAMALDAMPVLPTSAPTPVSRDQAPATRSRPLAVGEGLGDPPPSPTSERLVLLYGLGVLVLLTTRAVAALRLRAIVRRAAPLPAEGALRDSTYAALRLLQLGCADVRISDRVALPFVCGIWHPVVIVPSEAVEWPADRQLNVMLHELAHVRQHDVQWLAVWAVARSVHWFNPLAWLAMRDFRLVSEQLSDAWVVRHARSAADYAHDLVLMARHRMAMLSLSGALGLGHWSTLSTRIQAILAGDGAPHESRRRTLATVAGYLCVLLPVGIVTPVAQLATDSPQVRSTLNLSTGGPDISSNAAGLQARWVEGTLHRGLFVTGDPAYQAIHSGVVPQGASAMVIIEDRQQTVVTTFAPGERLPLPADILGSLRRSVSSFQSRTGDAPEAPTPAPPGKEFRPAHRSMQIGLPALSDDPGLAVTQAGWLQGSVRYALMVRGPWRVHRKQLLPNDSGSWLVLQAVDLATGGTRRVELRVADRRLLVNDAAAVLDDATEEWITAVYQVMQEMT